MTRLILVVILSVSASPVLAQAFGSVHCKASLRQIDIDLGATARRLEAVQQGSVEEKCSALRVRILTLEHASEVFGRCTRGGERDEKIGHAEASAAEFRAVMAQTCGG